MCCCCLLRNSPAAWWEWEREGETGNFLNLILGMRNGMRAGGGVLCGGARPAGRQGE